MRARFAAVLLFGCASCRAVARAQTQPSTAAAAAPPSDSVQRSNDEAARRVLARIAGREQDPAGQVFTNVKYLANVPARTFVSIMQNGYAKALGVGCAHCHVAGDYGSDDKRPKRAAREMQTMHRMINQELQKMDELETPKTANRAINCSTCHRGVAIPKG